MAREHANMRQSMALLAAPGRCVHIGDRESDIYELFCTAQELGTHFVVRSCVDRLAGDGDHTIAAEMDEVQVQGVHSVEVRDIKGRVGAAAVELRYRRIRVLPPIGKQKRYPALALTVIYARERDAPPDRPAINWTLITDLPVTGFEEAIEKLRWYALRWKIEVFHNPQVRLPRGSRAAADRGTTGEADRSLLHPELAGILDDYDQPRRAKRRLALTTGEIAILDRLVPDKGPGPKKLSTYLTKLARLGGYLARTRDPPPGNIVMWRGLSRLTDIALGAELAKAAPRCG